ncbi:uncharacterized protein LOC128331758 [Hemicordylus capensis]|uniref:uncharacterized protein LOC128331758 n=1 Tax=Hemicordylus capensis TaxID=884348 RepID=UPI0023037F66|nr:uncharacterized protein LOC128331758 [Hemicordylus capensis]
MYLHHCEVLPVFTEDPSLSRAKQGWVTKGIYDAGVTSGGESRLSPETAREALAHSATGSIMFLEDIVWSDSALELLQLLAHSINFWVFFWTAKALWAHGSRNSWMKIQEIWTAILRFFGKKENARYQWRRKLNTLSSVWGLKDEKILPSLSSTSLDSLSSLNSTWSSSSAEDKTLNLLETCLSPSSATPWGDANHFQPLPRPPGAGLKELRRESTSHKNVKFNLLKKKLQGLCGGPTPHSESLAKMISSVPRLHTPSDIVANTVSLKNNNYEKMLSPRHIQKKRFQGLYGSPTPHAESLAKLNSSVPSLQTPSDIVANTVFLKNSSCGKKWSPRHDQKKRAEISFLPLLPKAGPKSRAQCGICLGLADKPLSGEIQESYVSNEVDSYKTRDQVTLYGTSIQKKMLKALNEQESEINIPEWEYWN